MRCEREASGPTCSFDGCEKPVKAKGLCGGHYSQQYEGQPLRPLIERGGSLADRECDFPGCDKPAKSKGLCHGHAKQRRMGKPLRPLRNLPSQDAKVLAMQDVADGLSVSAAAAKHGMSKSCLADAVRSIRKQGGDLPPSAIERSLAAAERERDDLRLECGRLEAQNLGLRERIAELEAMPCRPEQLRFAAESNGQREREDIESRLRDVIGQRDLYKEANDAMADRLRDFGVDIDAELRGGARS